MRTDDLDQRLKALKSAYQELPPLSSRQRITKKAAASKKKWYLSGFMKAGYAAAAVVLLLAGSLLFASSEGLFPDRAQPASPHHQHQQPEPASPPKDEDPPQKNQPAKENKPKAIDRPAQKTVTIQNEGMDEKKVYNLIKNDSLQFSTYIPEDFKAEQSAEGGLSKTAIYTNYVGKLSHDNGLEIISGGASASADQLVEKLTGDSASALSSLEYHSLDFSKIGKVELVGKSHGKNNTTEEIYILKHGDKTYGFKVMYQPEMTEGLIPRLLKVIDEWKWYQ